MYTAINISSFFIQKGVTPLKLQKLLYYSQVWFFVKYDRKLFKDSIQAWIYGPVVRDVWSSFKYMKRGSVIPLNRAIDINYDALINNHLNNIWASYGHLTGSDLVDLTHNDLPWKNSRKGLLNDQPSGNEVIIDKNTVSDFSLSSNNTVPKVDCTNSIGRFSNIH